MLHLQALPFVPGRGQGIVRHGTAGARDRDAVLVLSPQEAVGLQPACAGLIIVDGSPLSHSLIRLMGFGLPMVRITAEQRAAIPEGAAVVLDGASGLVTAPDGAGVPPEAASPPAPRPGGAVKTADGTEVWLRASVADAAGAARALACGAAAIGLLRSEALAGADERPPGQAFYERALGEVCEAVDPLPVIVRLLDIAPDKCPAWLPAASTPPGTFGLQGVRLYEREPVHSVVKAQLAAAGRLAAKFDVRLLLPYVTGNDEFVRWRNEVEALLPVPLALGAMLETPAAALDISEWLLRADFVALGCNDLLQCLFGVDRDRPETGRLVDPHAPVTLRFLRDVAALAGDSAGEIQLCGLLPQVAGLLPLLLGLGYRTFSVEPALIPRLAGQIGKTDIETAQDLAVAACAAGDGAEVRMLLGMERPGAWALG